MISMSLRLPNELRQLRFVNDPGGAHYRMNGHDCIGCLESSHEAAAVFRRKSLTLAELACEQSARPTGVAKEMESETGSCECRPTQRLDE